MIAAAITASLYFRRVMRECPDTLMEALSEVRQSGDCNMIDLNCVCHVMTDMGYRDSAVWLNYNRDRYGDVLMELGEWLRDYTQPLEKSLAQELAEALLVGSYC